MISKYGPQEMTSPDAMISAAAHVDREYGYGYRIGLEEAGFRTAVFFVRHSDGSTFRLHADCYGNVDRLPDDFHELTHDQKVAVMQPFRDRLRDCV